MSGARRAEVLSLRLHPGRALRSWPPESTTKHGAAPFGAAPCGLRWQRLPLTVSGRFCVCYFTVSLFLPAGEAWVLPASSLAYTVHEYLPLASVIFALKVSNALAVRLPKR